HVIELVLDVPGKLDVPGSSTLLGGCSGGCLGGASTGSSTSSSWCSTFPGSSSFPGVQRCGEGVPGVTWEGRALARPLHRAGARRSQEARRSREFNVAERVCRGLPGGGEHWLVRVIELVLDVPRKFVVPGSSTLLGGCSGGYLGGTSTGSSASSSWCSTFPGNSTFPGVQRYWEGVPGVTWEARALARPR